MSSKQLNSILNTIPSATIEGERKNNINQPTPQVSSLNKPIEENERIVAVIPKELKEEIRSYLKVHQGITERIIILKSLKLLGFRVKDEWLIDKRSTR